LSFFGGGEVTSGRRGRFVKNTEGNSRIKKWGIKKNNFEKILLSRLRKDSHTW